MISTKNINGENNDITVAGTDFFADSESFLNELSDSEMAQVEGTPSVTTLTGNSNLSLLVCY
ncbi:hypothetical protein LC607_00070 [Nostoc sp. CHAB 5824]|nr:hypothetical protein [Nostoc sp. CHAB 5824]